MRLLAPETNPKGPKRATVVDVDTSGYVAPVVAQISPVLQALSQYPAEALYAQRRQLKQKGLEVFDFSVGDPREATPPLIRRAFRGGLPAVSQYPSVRGLPELRRACAQWLERRFGVTIDPETSILPCSGSKEAIFHTPLAFGNPADKPFVLYGTPAYPVYQRGTLFSGARPWPVELKPESHYALLPEELDPSRLRATRLIWVNYPHNPTGAVVSRDYLGRMLELSRRHDAVLCADECYVDLYYESAPPSALQAADGCLDGLLAFHSLSKRSAMTGYRSGFIAGDPELIRWMARLRANLGTAPAEPSQRAAIAAWSDDTHVEKRRALFRVKRDLFLAFFEECGLHCQPCAATFYLWLQVPAAFDQDDGGASYAKHLASAGILVSPAAQLGARQPYVRIALVPTAAQCRRAISAWRKLNG